MSPPLRTAVGVLGGLIFATAGAIIGSQNAGWFGLERNANDVLPVCGIGAGLVALAFARGSFSTAVAQVGKVGKTARVLIVVGCVTYILSWLIQFAIIGTLTLGIGLVCLAVAVTRHKLVPKIDRVLIILSAVGSLTWNTESVSAFLLVGVGLIWLILTIRLVPTDSLDQLRVDI